MTTIAATIIVVEIVKGAGVGDGEAVLVAVGVGVGVGLTGVVTVICATEELAEAPASSITSTMNDQAPNVAVLANVYW